MFMLKAKAGVELFYMGRVGRVVFDPVDGTSDKRPGEQRRVICAGRLRDRCVKK